MFTIYNKQIEKLDEARLLDFVATAAARLRTNFTQKLSARSDKELAQFILSGIQMAKRHGIDIEEYVIRYIGLIVKHGQDFDNQDWAITIIEAEKRNQIRTVNRLCNMSEKIINQQNDN